MAGESADWYTPTVGARTELGRALEARGEEWLKERKLKLSDVRALVTHGQAAHQADREQQEQLAEQAAERKERSANAASVTARESELADVLPAVVDDLLTGGQLRHARFLAKLSFVRYRIKVLSVPVENTVENAPADAESSEEVEEIKKVTRVPRADLATRADGLAAFCAALLKPGREPILAEMNSRGFDKAFFIDLEADATGVAQQGRNAPRPVEATARERESVLQQRLKWSAIRRLVKRAVEGDDELERLYRAC